MKFLFNFLIYIIIPFTKLSFISAFIIVIPFVSVSCFNAQWWLEVVTDRHLCLIFISKDSSKVSPLNVMFTKGFYVVTVAVIPIVRLSSHLLLVFKRFNMNRYWSFITCFIFVCCNDHMILLLLSVLVNTTGIHIIRMELLQESMLWEQYVVVHS